MNQHRNILFISFFLLLFAHGQYAQSPCPENFEYKQDESGTYGLIHVFPKGRVASITIKVNFTVAASLSKYLGKIESLGPDLAFIQQFNRGIPVHYRLHFPLSFPLPRITVISINDDIICTGPGDSRGNGQLVTDVGLQHRVYLMSDSGFNDPVRPSVVFETDINSPDRGNNIHSFLVTNGNDRFGENFRPPTPIDFNKIFSQQPSVTPSLKPERRPPTVDNNQCGLNGNIDRVPLIYNGISYDRGEWPWAVAIFKRNNAGLKYICSGSLISNRHVITAAHCMQGRTTLTSMNDIVVKVGVHNILDWADDVTVSRRLSSAIIHESFNSSTLANDILLMTFTKTVEFNVYIRPICLWSGNTDLNNVVGAAGVVAAWGLSELTAAGESEPRMVRMPIVSTDKCRASKQEFHIVTSTNTLCAGDRNGAGPCLGDSGSGLYMLDNGRWKLRGIVSLSLKSRNGDMSCNLDEYIVFTDAAQYLTWISDNMRT